MMVSYLPDQSCICKWRPDLSTQVELLILHNVYETQERGAATSDTLLYISNFVFFLNDFQNYIFIIIRAAP